MDQPSKKIAVMTGGGDCPGLNALIHEFVVAAENHQLEVVGFLKSWRGLIQNEFKTLNSEQTRNLQFTGGTFLQSSKTFPMQGDHPQKISETIRQNQLGGILIVGGESTLGVAQKLFEQEKLPMVGTAKTIDNDVFGTENAIGFSSAVDTVRESLDQLETTARSHSRILIVEVMGRDYGYLASFGGVAGGADLILTPEKPASIEDILNKLYSIQMRKEHAIIVVAEGFRLIEKGEEVQSKQNFDENNPSNLKLYGGIASKLREEISRNLEWEVREVVLGHLQRGGVPNAFDRILAKEFANHSLDLILKKKFGMMPVFSNGRVSCQSIQKTLSENSSLLKDFQHRFSNYFSF